MERGCDIDFVSGRRLPRGICIAIDDLVVYDSQSSSDRI